MVVARGEKKKREKKEENLRLGVSFFPLYDVMNRNRNERSLLQDTDLIWEEIIQAFLHKIICSLAPLIHVGREVETSCYRKSDCHRSLQVTLRLIDESKTLMSSRAS